MDVLVLVKTKSIKGINRTGMSLTSLIMKNDNGVHYIAIPVESVESILKVRLNLSKRSSQWCQNC